MKRHLTVLFAFGIILMCGVSVDPHRLPKQTEKNVVAQTGKDKPAKADHTAQNISTLDVSNNDAKSAKDSTNPEHKADSKPAKDNANQMSQKDSTAVKDSKTQSAQTDSNTKTKPTNQKVKECPASCRPSWLKLVTQYLGKVKHNSNPMCQFKTLFPACTAGSGCSNPVGKFSCCPLHCLKEINACWKGTGTEHICTPESVPIAWAMQMATAFFNMNG